MHYDLNKKISKASYCTLLLGRGNLEPETITVKDRKIHWEYYGIECTCVITYGKLYEHVEYTNIIECEYNYTEREWMWDYIIRS